jgi:hypothetical protein
VAAADPNEVQEAAVAEQQLAAEAAERPDGSRPDQVRPRGNPEIEQIDLDRGLDKIERVSGN